MEIGVEPTIDRLSDLEYERADINPAQLHRELADVLGSRLVGVSTDGKRARVHVLGYISAEEASQIADTVARHDASIAADEQIAEAEQIAQLLTSERPWTTAQMEWLLRIIARRVLAEWQT